MRRLLLATVAALALGSASAGAATSDDRTIAAVCGGNAPTTVVGQVCEQTVAADLKGNSADKARSCAIEVAHTTPKISERLLAYTNCRYRAEPILPETKAAPAPTTLEDAVVAMTCAEDLGPKTCGIQHFYVSDHIKRFGPDAVRNCAKTAAFWSTPSDRWTAYAHCIVTVSQQTILDSVH